jgi:uncharacterized protein YecT (DUF1311 family)
MNQTIAAAAVARLRTVLFVALAAVLSACNSDPSCSDAAAVQTLQNMAGEAVENLLVARPELIEPAKRGAAMSVTNIRTDKDDPETGARRCSATLRAEVPPQLAKELKGPAGKGFPGLNQLLQEVSIGDDHIEAEIKYRLRYTDDRQNTRIEAANLEAVPNVVIILAGLGFYPPAAKAPAAQTAVPAPAPAVVATQAPAIEPASTTAVDTSAAQQATEPVASAPAEGPTQQDFTVQRKKTVSGALIWDASFDCGQALTKVEEMICGSRALAQADKDMFNAYKQALQRTPDREALKREQRAWRQGVRDQCADEKCLADAYQARTAALAK